MSPLKSKPRILISKRKLMNEDDAGMGEIF
jgi:hypothetical protein